MEEYSNEAAPFPTPSIDIEENLDFNYNCSKCSSLIEIISINENNNILKFRCLNKNNNHSEMVMSLKEYFKEMKKYTNKGTNIVKCEIHKKNNKFISYCYDCNCHLCEECLKTRKHINHLKNNIIEIKPIPEELNILKEIIKYYKNKTDNLIIEKNKKEKELNESLNNNKLKENEAIKKKINTNKINEEKEIELSEKEYLNDLDK